ncbi:hypothetical protein, partial [Klebsiella pneumoniae]|uniref:hypothetical protein n=1 Tax=Klebsiella pneumoniae TaxID=573 RepID=UPI001CA57C74
LLYRKISKYFIFFGIKKPGLRRSLSRFDMFIQLFSPLSSPGIIKGQYRCIKLNAVDQDGARCQVKLNIVQG